MRVLRKLKWSDKNRQNQEWDHQRQTESQECNGKDVSGVQRENTKDQEEYRIIKWSTI